MSDKLDRRTMLSGAAFASLLALPLAPTAAGSPRPIGCEERNPIFAAIEAHRKAFLECEGCRIEEDIDRLSDIENNVLCELLEVIPTTLAGVMALSQYSAELTALFGRTGWSRSVTHPDDEEKSVDWSYYVHHHVADAIAKMTAVQRFSAST
jgi:hypothetical protein